METLSTLVQRSFCVCIRHSRRSCYNSYIYQFHQQKTPTFHNNNKDTISYYSFYYQSFRGTQRNDRDLSSTWAESRVPPFYLRRCFHRCEQEKDWAFVTVPIHRHQRRDLHWWGFSALIEQKPQLCWSFLCSRDGEGKINWPYAVWHAFLAISHSAILGFVEATRPFCFLHGTLKLPGKIKRTKRTQTNTPSYNETERKECSFRLFRISLTLTRSFLSLSLYLYLYIYIHTYIYIYVHTHTHTHTYYQCQVCRLWSL